MKKKWTPATELQRARRTPAQTPAQLIAAWLKTNKPKKFAVGEVTPKEEQGGWGFGRGRKPKAKAVPTE